MAVRDAVMAGIAKQLGHPSGLRGRFVGMLLNRGNRAFVSAAVQALQPQPSAEVADIGFGGGVGLRFLLDSVGKAGLVHGVEISETMLVRARHRYRREIAAGRLTLRQGSSRSCLRRWTAERSYHRQHHLLRHRVGSCVRRTRPRGEWFGPDRHRTGGPRRNGEDAYQ